MGIRTRGLDMRAGFKRDAADKAARAEAEVVIQRWNWLDVFCRGCGTTKAIDLRTVDRHPLASVGWCSA
jgi:hypothetical protein